MRFHISAAVLVTVFSLVYHLTAEQYGLLFFVIGAVLALEAVNTAIERLADAVSEDYHPLIGAAKDLAAGAVLMMAIAAIFVGFALFFPLSKADSYPCDHRNELALSSFSGASPARIFLYVYLSTP